MKKLFMLAMAAAFSMAMVTPGFAQAPATTEKKAEKAEKKADKADMKAEKAEKKADKAEKKADKAEKKAEKKAANPCAAKAEKK